VAVGLVALGLGADERWTGLRSGPFEVLTTGSDKAAREKLMFLEQFRETIRVITGKQEMRSVWPIRVVIVKNGAARGPALGRDARMMAVTESGAFPRESLKELARVMLYENTNRLPQPIEAGIIELVSTLEVNGTHVTLGAPVPEAERSHGWALMQLVTVNPDYSGRSRVMISNLEQSGDFEAACRNAFQKTAAQINQQADAYLKAGSFATTSVSGRALSLTRDFKPMQLDPDSGKVAMADLLLATGPNPAATAAYTAIHGAQGTEGLALVALKEHKENEARTLLRSAIESKSESARAWLELGRLEPNEKAARADLKKAGELNPLWSEPHFRMAEIEDDPAQKAVLLKKAAALEARNIDYWQALARAETAAKNFPEVQKAWAGAERACANDEERARIHQVRLNAETEKMDFEASEKKRIEEEQAREVARVKAINDASVHAAEQAANKRLNPEGAAAPKPEGWWEDMQGNAKVEGVFQRLDCLGKQARVVMLTADGKTVQLLVRDPSQIAIEGGGEKALSCGVQKPPRQALVQFLAKPDLKLKTSGEVTSIEFR
jgi:hypothetical protein